MRVLRSGRGRWIGPPHPYRLCGPPDFAKRASFRTPFQVMLVDFCDLALTAAYC
jgi:hypothetical protein